LGGLGPLVCEEIENGQTVQGPKVKLDEKVEHKFDFGRTIWPRLLKTCQNELHDDMTKWIIFMFNVGGLI
jgi:hypothetical protein